MKTALVVWGGWEGHTPKESAAILAEELGKNGFRVRLENDLAPLANRRALKRLDLIVPFWTMGELPAESWRGLSEAVRGGVGLAGIHGGAGDAFRGNLEFQWMVGGQFVGHPHVGPYTVRPTAVRSPITRGLKQSFRYDSEQYYMLTDPGNTVLATTVYKHDGRRTVMPVVWTRTWGKGRVFYSALGHVWQEFLDYPEVLAMTVRGMLWAAAGKD